MLKRRNFKKSLLTGSLILTALLTGCGKTKEEKVKEWAEENNYQLTKIEESSEEPEINEEANPSEVLDEQISEFASKSYNKYRDFYEYKGYTEEDIKMVVTALNVKIENLDSNKIDKITNIIDSCMLSDNFETLLKNVNTMINQEDNPIEDEGLKQGMVVYDSPLISELIIDKDTESYNNIKSYELLREKLVSEIKENKTYSDAIVKEINDALIAQESSEYTIFNGDMDAEEDKIFVQYALSTAKFDLVNLATKVNPNSYYIEDEKGLRYKLAPSTEPNENGEIETDIQNDYIGQSMDGNVTDEIAQKWSEIESTLVSTKYIEERCNIIAILKDSVLELSKDGLINMKNLLLAKKEESKMILSMKPEAEEYSVLIM